MLRYNTSSPSTLRLTAAVVLCIIMSCGPFVAAILRDDIDNVKYRVGIGSYDMCVTSLLVQIKRSMDLGDNGRCCCVCIGERIYNSDLMYFFFVQDGTGGANQFDGIRSPESNSARHSSTTTGSSFHHISINQSGGRGRGDVPNDYGAAEAAEKEWHRSKKNTPGNPAG